MRHGDELRNAMRGTECIYCGETATTDEHFPPASLTGTGWIFCACAECNSLANDHWPFDFQKRAAMVKEKITVRYRKEIEFPDYGIEELIGLTLEMAIEVIKCLKLKLSTQNRIAWNAESYFYLNGWSNPFAVINADNLGTTEKDKPLFQNTKVKNNDLLNRKCKQCGDILRSKRIDAIYCNEACGTANRKSRNLQRLELCIAK